MTDTSAQQPFGSTIAGRPLPPGIQTRDCRNREEVPPQQQTSHELQPEK